MAVPFSNTKLRVPRGFQNLLEGLAKEVLRNQPDNINAFAAIYFDNLLKIRAEQGIDPAEIGAKHEDRFYNNKAFSKAGNMGDVSDPQQQQAATTIQAAVRGQQVREEAKEDTAVEDAAKEDEAATRIQAAYRGYEARKRVNLLKDEDDDGKERTEAQAEEEEEIDIDLNDPEVEKAATKIQASFRGFQTRKTMKDKDKPSEDAEPPGEGDPQDQQISTEETTQPTESDKPSIEEKEEKEEEEEIDIDLTDPEVEKAAIKIQGGFKMIKAKKQVEEMKKSKEETNNAEEATDEKDTTEEKAEETTEVAAPAEEEEVDIDLDDPEVGKAAEKIQASFRGFQTRKKLKEDGGTSEEMNQQSMDNLEHSVSSKADISASRSSTREQGQFSHGAASDAEIHLAASRIQAGFKGMMVRKELASLSSLADQSHSFVVNTSESLFVEVDDIPQLSNVTSKDSSLAIRDSEGETGSSRGTNSKKSSMVSAVLRAVFEKVEKIFEADNDQRLKEREEEKVCQDITSAPETAAVQSEEDVHVVPDECLKVESKDEEQINAEIGRGEVGNEEDPLPDNVDGVKTVGDAQNGEEVQSPAIDEHQKKAVGDIPQQDVGKDIDAVTSGSLNEVTVAAKAAICLAEEETESPVMLEDELADENSGKKSAIVEPEVIPEPDAKGEQTTDAAEQDFIQRGDNDTIICQKSDEEVSSCEIPKGLSSLTARESVLEHTTETVPQPDRADPPRSQTFENPDSGEACEGKENIIIHTPLEDDKQGNDQIVEEKMVNVTDASAGDEKKESSENLKDKVEEETDVTHENVPVIDPADQVKVEVGDVMTIDREVAIGQGEDGKLDEQETVKDNTVLFEGALQDVDEPIELAEDGAVEKDNHDVNKGGSNSSKDVSIIEQSGKTPVDAENVDGSCSNEQLTQEPEVVTEDGSERDVATQPPEAAEDETEILASASYMVEDDGNPKLKQSSVEDMDETGAGNEEGINHETETVDAGATASGVIEEDEYAGREKSLLGDAEAVGSISKVIEDDHAGLEKASEDIDERRDGTEEEEVKHDSETTVEVTVAATSEVNEDEHAGLEKSSEDTTEGKDGTEEEDVNHESETSVEVTVGATSGMIEKDDHTGQEQPLGEGKDKDEDERERVKSVTKASAEVSAVPTSGGIELGPSEGMDEGRHEIEEGIKPEEEATLEVAVGSTSEVIVEKDQVELEQSLVAGAEEGGDGVEEEVKSGPIASVEATSMSTSDIRGKDEHTELGQSLMEGINEGRARAEEEAKPEAEANVKEAVESAAEVMKEKEHAELEQSLAAVTDDGGDGVEVEMKEESEDLGKEIKEPSGEVSDLGLGQCRSDQIHEASESVAGLSGSSHQTVSEGPEKDEAGEASQDDTKYRDSSGKEAKQIINSNQGVDQVVKDSTPANGPPVPSLLVEEPSSDEDSYHQNTEGISSEKENVESKSTEDEPRETTTEGEPEKTAGDESAEVTGDDQQQKGESEEQGGGDSEEQKDEGAEEEAKGEVEPSEETKAEEEEEVDIDLTDPEVEQAALKIQAGFKGFKARKELKGKADAPPTEKEDSPEETPAAEPEAPPTEEEAAPSSEQDPPTEGDAPPPAEEKEPAAEEATPAGEAPPTEGDTPPANADAPPTEADAPPTEADAPPTETDAPPTEADAQPTETDAPTTEADAPPAEADAQPTETDALPTETDVPPTQTDVPPIEGEVPPTDADTKTVEDPPVESGEEKSADA
ncbi:uncharacterized protein [Apostichopus japonicus]|uniref:uncharacterized protein isoform X2 n=1 Tax=Stichopus japonicus TaxID=307972 RepID=UPI003AB1F497